MPFTKTEVDEKRRQYWHLDKSVSITHLLTTISIIAGIFTFASKIDTRISLLEAAMINGQLNDSRIEKLVVESHGRIESSINRMEGRIDTWQQMQSNRK